MESEIINRVSVSDLISFDLENIYPEGDCLVFDIKDLLFEGTILKEKEYRAFIKSHNWENYTGKNVAICCSEDAIIPTWAFMLPIVKMQPYAKMVVFGNKKTLEEKLWSDQIAKLDLTPYINGKVVVKGCGKKYVPIFAYTELTRVLMPIVYSIMFGEPCSTVPLYKKQKF